MIPEPSRRLSVIMFTDIEGFSARMGADETRTYDLLQQHNVLVRAKLQEAGGRVIKTIGDAFMAEFESTVAATRAALAVQRGMAELNAGRDAGEQVRVRIGLHLGEVLHDESGDVFGDGVNVAARLEGHAPPGGICLSETIVEALRGKLPELRAVRLGPLNLKNIAQPVTAYAVLPPNVSAREESRLHPYASWSAWRTDLTELPAAVSGTGAAKRTLRTFYRAAIHLPSLLVDFCQAHRATSREFRVSYLSPAAAVVVGVCLVVGINVLLQAAGPDRPDFWRAIGYGIVEAFCFVLVAGFGVSMLSRERFGVGQGLALGCYVYGAAVAPAILLTMVTAGAKSAGMLPSLTYDVVALTLYVSIVSAIQATGLAAATRRNRVVMVPLFGSLMLGVIAVTQVVLYPANVSIIGAKVCLWGKRGECVDRLSRMAVERAPLEERAWLLRVLVLESEGDPVRAGEAAWQGAHLIPRSAWLHYLDAKHAPNLDVAEQEYVRALALDPDLTDASAGLADLYLNRRQWEKAFAHCAATIVRRPASPELRQLCQWVMALAEFHLKRYEEALMSFYLVEEVQSSDRARFLHAGARALVTAITHFGAEHVCQMTLVVGVEPGTTAERIGITAGDLLWRVGDAEPHGAVAWAVALEHHADAEVPLTVVGGGGIRQVSLPPNAGRLGLTLQDLFLPGEWQ